MPFPTQREKAAPPRTAAQWLLLGQVVIRNGFGDERSVFESERLPEEMRSVD